MDIKRIIIVCLIVFFVLLLLHKIYTCKKRQTIKDVFKVLEYNPMDITIYEKYIYILTEKGDTIKKYKNKKKIAEKKLSFKCKQIYYILGDIVCLNTENNRLIWLDALTLNFVDTIELPVNNVEWLCYDSTNKWWLYKNNTLLCFDAEWKPLGFWKSKIKLMSGDVIKEHLYACDDEKNMYIFYLDPEKVKLKMMKKIKLPFNNNFVLDLKNNKIWGLNDNMIICADIN
jgi:hypothetical protein